MKEGQDKEKRYYCNDRFSVSSIQYNGDREISSLVIVNDRGQAVYAMKSRDSDETADERKGKDGSKEGSKKNTGQKKMYQGSISKGQMDSLCAELERTGVTMETVQERYRIQKPESMSEELYGRVMAALSKTRSVKVA